MERWNFNLFYSTLILADRYDIINMDIDNKLFSLHDFISLDFIILIF